MSLGTFFDKARNLYHLDFFIGYHQQLVFDTSKMEEYEKSLATLSTSALLKHQSEITLKDVVTEPQEILALFASSKQQEKGTFETFYYVKMSEKNVMIDVSKEIFLLGNVVNS